MELLGDNDPLLVGPYGDGSLLLEESWGDVGLLLEEYLLAGELFLSDGWGLSLDLPLLCELGDIGFLKCSGDLRGDLGLLLDDDLLNGLTLLAGGDAGRLEILGPGLEHRDVSEYVSFIRLKLEYF